ncbi:MAG: hypothetical protein LBN29_08060 [Mediterranea sp.]|jgi:hypothetical protein|nr:hypothetical protein [Mediterranea sp.]
MTTIRPSVYIGLGGSGIKAIAKTKKMYEDIYGKNNMPEEIAFVAIDFDLAEGDNPSLATDMKSDFLYLRGIENPKRFYDVCGKEGECSWMFPQNARFIDDRTIHYPIRTNGRFLTEMFIRAIERRITDCITRVSNIRNDREYGIEKLRPIDIHIAVSLAGGMGGGSFLNLAMLIRDRFRDQVNVVGYGISYGVFVAMNPSRNLVRHVVNAYSAILDLDYLMNASAKNPVTLSLNGEKTTLARPIFDEFYVIDNETESGMRIDNVSELCEALGTYLYMAGKEMGWRLEAKKSGIGWWFGLFDIPPKPAWVQALGVCQVVYRGELLAEIYGLKAAIGLIRKLRQKDADMRQQAADWIEAVGIPPLHAKDTMTSIAGIVNTYVEHCPDFPDEKELKAHSDELAAKLNDKIAWLINKEHGIGNTLIFLAALEEMLTRFQIGMKSESTVFEKKAREALDRLASNYEEYEKCPKKFFISRRKKEEQFNSLIARPAQLILKDRLETKRRGAALDICSNLLSEIDMLKTKVGQIDKKMSQLMEDYENELAVRQNSSESTLAFEYDLSRDDRLNMKLEDNDVVIADYISSLGKSLLDLDGDTELSHSLLAFTNTLKGANEYRDKLIIDVIDQLDEQDYKVLKEQIVEKSSRLLRLEDRGLVNKLRRNILPTKQLEQIFLIEVPRSVDEAGIPIKSRLEGDSAFQKDVFVSFGTDSMRQRIIVCRQDMAIIPYCVGAFDAAVEREYAAQIGDASDPKPTTFNPHFDKELFEEMRRRGFKLKPEMRNEDLLYWVCGNIFGWESVKETMYIMAKDSNGMPLKIDHKEEVEHVKYIRMNKTKYYFWNEDGDSTELEGKWTPLGNTTRRDTAFMYFKTSVLPQIKPMLRDKIRQDIAKRGKAYYEAMIDNIADGGYADYVDRLICTGKNSLTYETQDGGELSQLTEEWHYIRKHLKNALSEI